MKVRIDELLLERGLASSLERAQSLILAGKVLVKGQKLDKAGTKVDSTAEVRMLGEDSKYVSRGGLKLEKALEEWKIDVIGKVCLDIGTSTGGFTDCLLQKGAARIIAVDTGHGQIDFRLRQDTRVKLLEKTNARYLEASQIGEGIDLVVMDVSFISATSVLPAVIIAAFPNKTTRQVVVLVKPQFEVERGQVGKGGIVRDPILQEAAAEKVRQCLIGLGCTETALIDSPILGAEGNREYLLYGRS